MTSAVGRYPPMLSGARTATAVIAMSDDDELPVPKEDVERLEKELGELEGSVSSRFVPLKAYDVGETPIRANPRACDLGEPEGITLAVAHNFGGDQIMYDESNGDAQIVVEDDATFIHDITEWN